MSLLYDAVFFLIMVSLSGVVLIPALQNDISIEASVDKHREHVADEALNMLLVSRSDEFSYKILGDIIDDTANSIGIENTSDGIYSSILDWILAREQLHKTYSNLISENLGCQLKFPISIFGNNRFNILTGDFDKQLKIDLKNFLKNYIGDKYELNFSAVWHPIKGIGFGGDIYIGHSPPDTNCYVAKSNIMMPFKPTFIVNSTVINFTRYWFEEEVLKNISIVSNITCVVQDYKLGNKPYNNYSNVSIAINENLTILINQFLVDGINDEENNTLFPGIINLTLSFGFDKIKSLFSGFFDKSGTNILDEGFNTLDNIFEKIGGNNNPLFYALKDYINSTLFDFLGESFSNVSDALNHIEYHIRDEIEKKIEKIVSPYIQNFVDVIIQDADYIDLYDFLTGWLFDRISINRAEVSLMIWEVRG